MSACATSVVHRKNRCVGYTASETVGVRRMTGCEVVGWNTSAEGWSNGSSFEIQADAHADWR